MNETEKARESIRIAISLGDKQLSLYGMGLRDLPVEIEQLTSLVYLDLSGNKLKSLPDSIKELRNLECLDLSGNEISRTDSIVEELENRGVVVRIY